MRSTLPVRALVVDDDPQMARLLEAVIQQACPDDVQIKTATHPKAARQYLETEVVDLLVTDLEMPGISGIELLRCAKRRNAWTQVLLVTGHSSLGALADAMELGAADYLLKPLDWDELKDAVGCVISRLFRWRRALAGTFATRTPASDVAPPVAETSCPCPQREFRGGREL
jgi:DNA-binding NtrC family response regulator